MLSDHILKEETCLWVTDMSPGSLRVTGHLTVNSPQPHGEVGASLPALEEGKGKAFPMGNEANSVPGCGPRRGLYKWPEPP